MTDAERNRELVEGFYRNDGSGGMAGLLSRLADDVAIVEPPFLPFGRTFRGRDGFREVFREVGRYLDLADVRLEYTVADGDRVIACLSIPDRATGRPVCLLEQSTVRDGAIAEIKLFYHDVGTMIDKASRPA